MFKYYRGAFLFTIIAGILGYVLGGTPVALIVLLLGVLEVSLSFDNAVVNASILKNWNEKWRRRFLVFGMPIAVFGMRLAFPLIIVATIVGIGPLDVVNLALHDPNKYEEILISAHTRICAFGSVFLSMIFLNFFLDPQKDSHWLVWLEKPLKMIGHLQGVQVVIALVVLYLVSKCQPTQGQFPFLCAGLFGLISYLLAQAFGVLVGGDVNDVGVSEVNNHIVRQGIMGLLYLELLDASFSFDGVMGSFAMSNKVFVIALGLGVGAMFVRSMTLHLVDRGTLNEYPYLANGAFWAIGALAATMYISTIVPVPEIVSGTIGASLIGFALWSSILENRRAITPAHVN